MSGILAGALCLIAQPAPAQQTSCLPPDDTSASLVPYVVLLATGTDERTVATRARYGLVAVPESEVELITTNQTCKKAAREYKRVVGLQGQAPDVHVVRIGTRFVVTNSEVRAGEFGVYIVFDEQFNVLAKFVG